MAGMMRPKPQPEPVKPKTKVQGCLVLIVGHSQRAGGAKAVAPLSMNEYQYNTLVAEDCVEFGKDKGLTVHVLLKDTMGSATVGKKASDLVKKAGGGRVIELHFNAATPAARGCEVIYDTREPGNLKFATLLRDNIVKTLGTLKRKVLDRTASGRGAANIRYVTVTGALVEPAFGSNKQDATLLLTKRGEYAKCLVDTVLADMGAV